MNMEALKKGLLQGIPSGIVTWLIYGLVFRLLIDKKPFSEALFSRDSIVFFGHLHRSGSHRLLRETGEEGQKVRTSSRAANGRFAAL